MASRRSSRQTRSSNQQSNQEQSRAKWNGPLTETLVDLMVVEVQKGNKQNNSFDKKAWMNICDGFHNKTGLNWDKEQLRSRFIALKKQYTSIKSILDHNDFTWDESRQIVIGTNEAWDEYLEAHPDAETVKSNGCSIYKQLSAIFSESTKNENTDIVYLPMETEEDNVKTAVITTISSGAKSAGISQEESLSTTDEDDNESRPSKKIKRQSLTTPSTDRKRNTGVGVEDTMVKAILEMVAASKLRTAAVTEGSDRFSISNCVKALDELEGIDDHLYYTALDLFDNPNLREVFMALKIEKRLVWLRGKCNSTSIYSSIF